MQKIIRKRNIYTYMHTYIESKKKNTLSHIEKKTKQKKQMTAAVKLEGK